jgi:hypothetical protein
MRRAALLPLTLATLATPRPAAAQPDTTLGAAACDGRIVTAVEIRAEPPAVIGRTPPGWARPVLRVLLQSPRTEESAVRPFLLLREGDRCTEFRRAESERLLRAQPYIAGARVAAVPEGDGVRLVVETEDDVALIVGGGVRDGTLSRLRYGNANLFGLGMLGAAEWERGGAYRDGWGGQFEHYHAFGGRQVVTLDAWRGPRDERYAAAVARPFLTDAQRIAWSVRWARDDRFVDFPVPGADAPSLDYARDAYGASWVARLGSRGRTLLGGLSLGHERGEPRGAPVFVTDSGLVAADAPRLASAYRDFSATRVGVVAGTRALAFRRLLVLDSLGGAQDVASGVQLVGTVGYEFGDEAVAGIASGRTDGREPFGVADLYAGVATDRSLTSLAVLGEGRRAPAGGSWDDVALSARLSWYRRASARRTHAVSAEFEGAWDARRPYRVTLGSWEHGVRGYRGSQVAGARLAVLRVEERWALGGFGGLAGFGAAAFGDVGKVWAGEVPYGTTTSVRAAVGAGLLVAVPRRSQRFYRLDVAAPLARDRDAGSFTVRLSRAFPFGRFGLEGGDLAGARAARPAAALLPPP